MEGFWGVYMKVGNNCRYLSRVLTYVAYLRNDVMMTVLGKSLDNCFRVFIFLIEMLY